MVMLFGCNLLVATDAKAYPALQLDILGGTYDSVTQTITSDGPTFTLIALATPTGSTSAAEILADTFYISTGISSAPEQSAGFNVGSFKIGGTTVQATDAEMEYGTPPIDAAHNTDLPGHGVYPTYYHEVSFQFNANDTTTSYNSEDDTGGILFDENGIGSFFVKLEIDATGLYGETLHFDLYNTELRNNGSTTVDNFAPFSHDAQSAHNTSNDDPGDIPEPASLIVFMMSLALLIYMRRRSSKIPGNSLPIPA